MDSQEKILVPRVIYETIENVLEAQVRKLAIDIAKTLNVNEKILLSELKKDKLSILILDESESADVDSLRCKAYDKHEHVYVPCEEPVIYKKDFCTKHIVKHTIKEELQEHICLVTLKYDNITYYRDKNNKVYNTKFNVIGYYKPSIETIIELAVTEEKS